MLSLLNIANIALIEDLRIEFEGGLNLITGETGSGKSIIVDALGLLIGGRFSTDLIKSGASSAFVEGLFSMQPALELTDMLAAAGMEMDRDELIIRRELSATGKSKIF